jgi:hypothetical protein
MMRRTLAIAMHSLRWSVSIWMFSPIACLSVSLAGYPTPSRAEEYLIQDRDGRRVGTIKKIESDKAIVLDRYGRRVGTISGPVGKSGDSQSFPLRSDRRSQKRGR